MKAQNLNKVVNGWEMLRKYWWCIPIIVGVWLSLMFYLKKVWSVQDPPHIVDKIVVPVQVETLPRGLEKMKADEILIIRKDNENLVKLILLPDSALQHWADSLLNAPAARGQRF
jgi:hypothetical protein